MKNLILVLMITLTSFAAANASENMVDKLSCGEAATLLEATKKLDVDKGYVRVLKDKSCRKGYTFFLNSWEEGEKAESVNYWENAEEKFCIDRSVSKNVTDLKSTVALKLLIDGEFIAADSITDFKSSEGVALIEFFEQEEKLYSLEALGLIKPGLKYPDCKI